MTQSALLRLDRQTDTCRGISCFDLADLAMGRARISVSVSGRHLTAGGTSGQRNVARSDLVGGKKGGRREERNAVIGDNNKSNNNNHSNNSSNNSSNNTPTDDPSQLPERSFFSLTAFAFSSRNAATGNKKIK